MASLLDSVAHFEARAREYNIPAEWLEAMSAAGVTTLAHLAFSIARPGQEFSEENLRNGSKL